MLQPLGISAEAEAVYVALGPLQSASVTELTRLTSSTPECVAETLEGVLSGRISELFACGTAAVITPIASLHNDEGDVVVGSGAIGEVTAALRETLMDIQYGRAEDTHGWMKRIV